ncbi:MAG: hypothetical protein ACOVOR_03060 [Rhabdochlamydiaceae bacterium]
MAGHFSPSLRALKISISDKESQLYFYYDAKISKDDELSTMAFISNMKNIFPFYDIKWTALRIDYPIPIPQEGILLYQRQESLLNEYIEKEKKKWPFIQRDNRQDFFLCLIKALLGRIPENLDCITIEWVEKDYILYFFYREKVGYQNYSLIYHIAEELKESCPLIKGEIYIAKGDLPDKENLQLIYLKKQSRL